MFGKRGAVNELFSKDQEFKSENAGMSLLEVLIAVSMLIVFTGVFAMVMHSLCAFLMRQAGKERR